MKECWQPLRLQLSCKRLCTDMREIYERDIPREIYSCSCTAQWTTWVSCQTQDFQSSFPCFMKLQ